MYILTFLNQTSSLCIKLCCLTNWIHTVLIHTAYHNRCQSSYYYVKSALQTWARRWGYVVMTYKLHLDPQNWKIVNIYSIKRLFQKGASIFWQDIPVKGERRSVDGFFVGQHFKFSSYHLEACLYVRESFFKYAINIKKLLNLYQTFFIFFELDNK